MSKARMSFRKRLQRTINGPFELEGNVLIVHQRVLVSCVNGRLPETVRSLRIKGVEAIFDEKSGNVIFSFERGSSVVSAVKRLKAMCNGNGVSRTNRQHVARGRRR